MKAHACGKWIGLCLANVAAVAALGVLGCGRNVEEPPQQRPPEVWIDPADEPQTTPEEFREFLEQQRREQLPEAIAAPPPDALQPHDAGPPPAMNFGYTPPTEAERREFLQTLPDETLREAAPHFFEARGPPAKPASLQRPTADEPVLLYRPLDEAHRRKYGTPFRVGKQGIGDCVSWGWAHGGDVLLAISYIDGRSGDFEMIASEATYGLARVEGSGKTRGGYSDGSYGAAAARAVTRFGFVLRKDYRDRASAETDLRSYSSSRAKAWGNFGCGGADDAGRLDEIAKTHAVRQVALVTTWDEFVAAIQNGYPVAICSGQGFTSTRDADGFCRASGSWSHCMVAIGVRFASSHKSAARPVFDWPGLFRARGGDGAALEPLVRPVVLQPIEASDRDGGLILNSWGTSWVGGPKWPSDQPDGSFWCERKTLERMLAGRDSYAMSDVIGFPRRELRLLQDF